MTLNVEMALILHYFTEFGSLQGALSKRSRSLPHLLMSSCLLMLNQQCQSTERPVPIYKRNWIFIKRAIINAVSLAVSNLVSWTQWYMASWQIDKPVVLWVWHNLLPYSLTVVVDLLTCWCRFYSHDSSFVHSGMDQSGDEQSVVVGQAVSPLVLGRASVLLFWRTQCSHWSGKS